MNQGQVGILNVGAGDTKLSFDPNNPQDAIRAARVVKAMLRQGYALLVDSGRKGPDDRPIYVRAKDFDETKHEYIIADYDPTEGETEYVDRENHEPSATTRSDTDATPKLKGRTKRVPAASTHAVAVSRSAGG